MYVDKEIEIRVYRFTKEVGPEVWESPKSKNLTFKIITNTYMYKGRKRELMDTGMYKVKGHEVSDFIQKLKAQ
jgi:hypothetical protein